MLGVTPVQYQNSINEWQLMVEVNIPLQQSSRRARERESRITSYNVCYTKLLRDDSEDSPSDYLPWCQAYLAGVDQAAEDWFECLEEDRSEDAEEQVSYLDERLFPLMVLTGEAEAAAKEHGEEWPEGDERAEIEQDSYNFV